jgi:hypothetical protein
VNRYERLCALLANCKPPKLTDEERRRAEQENAAAIQQLAEFCLLDYAELL